MISSVKSLLRRVAPHPLYRLYRRRRIQRLTSEFTPRTVTHEYAGHRLTIFRSLTVCRHLLEEFPHPSRLQYCAHLPRENVRSLLQGASVLVQPSEEENFGSSVAEAVAHGTPVLVGSANGTGAYVDAGGATFADYRGEDVVTAIARVLDRLERSPEDVGADARLTAEADRSVTHGVDGLESALCQATRLTGSYSA